MLEYLNLQTKEVMMQQIFDDVIEMFNNDVDGVIFEPDDDEYGVAHGINYEQNDDKLYYKGNLGHWYDILTYKLTEDDEIKGIDVFSAILTDPKVYINHLIKCGFFGVFVKKSDTSLDFINGYVECLAE